MFPHEIARNFTETYRCFSVSMMSGPERQDVERGGKSRPINRIISSADWLLYFYNSIVCV